MTGYRYVCQPKDRRSNIVYGVSVDRTAYRHSRAVHQKKAMRRMTTASCILSSKMQRA